MKRAENGMGGMKRKRCTFIHPVRCRGSKHLRSINRHHHPLLTMHPLTTVNPDRLRVVYRQEETLHPCLAHLNGHEPAEDGVFLRLAWSLEGG